MKIVEKINSLSNRQLILIIFLVGFLTFANMLGNSFVWDDEEMVVKNFPLFQLGNTPQFFRQATFFSGGSALSGWFYRPLVMMAFLLTRVVFGESPAGFHLVQLVFHLLSASIIFFVFKSLFEKENKQLAKPLSLLLALIFVVHPAHVEAVSYIASIAESVYTFLILLTFLLIIRAKNRKPAAKLSLLVGLTFLLALLTKEGAAVFLAMAIIYLYLFQKERMKSWIPALGLGFLGYFAIRLVFFGLQTQRPNFLSPISEASFGQRLLTGPLVFFSFLKTFFFPKTLSVSQHMVVRSGQDYRFWLSLGIIILFLFGVSLFLLKTKNKLGFFFFSWFLISVLPVLNIIMPLDMSFAERWLYFPMFGLLGLLGVVFLKYKYLSKNFVFVLPSLVIAVALLSLRTISRNSDWKDGFTLYSHDIKIEPESFDLQNNLGVELFRRGEQEKALAHFEKSVELQPHWTISQNNLAATYEHFGDGEKAHEFYSRAVAAGEYYLAYENLASLTFKMYGPERTLEFLDEALVKFPNSEKLNFLAAVSYYQTGEKTLALKFAQRLYSLNPTGPNSALYRVIREGKEIRF